MTEGSFGTNSLATITASNLKSHQISIRDYVAMGTQFTITAVECSVDVMDDLVNYTNTLESLWTRFRDSSELMQINLNPGEIIKVSPETIRLLQEMQYGFELTAGLYDPNVLRSMINSGFGESLLNPAEHSRLLGTSQSNSTVDDLIIDINNCTVMNPSGLGLDAGGIGKGLAADLLAERALSTGVQGISVFAGGEVRVAGVSPMEAGWTVNIQHPLDENVSLGVLDLIDGGVATSSPIGRLSEAGGHIIDPKKQTPTNEVALQATVVAGDCVDAEVLAKMCLLMPPALAIERIEKIGVDALIYTSDDKLFMSAGWEELCQ